MSMWRWRCVLWIAALVCIGSSLPAAGVMVNFQPSDSQVPAGYVPDSGEAFGNRNNGYTYGWQSPNSKVYDRLDEHADQRYDTNAYFDSTGVWEIALEEDEYELFIVCGDALYTNQVNTIEVEGVKLTDPDGVDYFDEYEMTVMVTDSRLTIGQAFGGSNAKICFIDISPTGLSNHAPFVNAGGDVHQVWPDNRFIPEATVEDDGKGNPDGFLQIEWSVLSGTGEVAFSDMSIARPTITFSAVGLYVLRLHATDGELERNDDIIVIVDAPECPVGDLTYDCKVLLEDLVLFADQWLGDDTQTADFVDNDGVNLGDLDQISSNWLDDWTGTLQITLEPAEAIEAGAMWRVDGGDWQQSEQVVTDLREGDHTVEFRQISQWNEPATQTVYIYRRVNVIKTGTYVGLPNAELVLNEFMAINSNMVNLRPTFSWNLYTRVEGELEYPDWIEIRNTTGQVQSLDGWYLTDDPDWLTKWRFPDGYEVPVNGYFVVYASNKDQKRFPANYPYVDQDGHLHTNFDLDGDGEYLALVRPDGTTIAHEYNDYPEQRGLVSYGIGGNDRIGYLMSATRGGANTDAYDGMVADTKFSVDRGFYDSPIDVAITCETEDARIRYTTDQSVPTLTNGKDLLPGQTVRISTTTCLRAAAFKDNYLSTNVDTHTYLFLNDVIHQATNTSTGAQVTPSGFPEIWPGGSYRNPPVSITGDYQMDPDVVNATEYSGTIKNDLKAIPTVSLVVPKEDMFGDDNGIYINEDQDGTERRGSVELIDPAGLESGFQVNCGVRMQGGVGIGGGTSLDRWKVPKLSMKLVFRGGYGPSRLRYEMFEEPHATTWFDQIILEARANNVWYHSDSNQNRKAQYTRDQFAADMQNAMGGRAPCGRPIHLYINGLYWGLYWIHERPDESFAAAYFGGEPEDYNVLKHNAGLVVNGILTATQSFQEMYNIPTNDYAYLQRRLDVVNFIDYLILHFYFENGDWPTKNWYASQNRNDPEGQWRFHTWDSEHIMDDWGGDPVAPDGAPTALHDKWMVNQEYAMLFADRVYKHLYNGGILTPENVVKAYRNLVDEIDRAIVGESARWGDFRRPSDPYTRNNEWWAERQRLLNTYLPGCRDRLISKLRGLQWYPPVSFDPPQFRINDQLQHGGYVLSNSLLTLSGSNTLWYTLDGADPRSPASSGGSSEVLVSEDAEKKVIIPLNDIGSNWTGADELYDDSDWNDYVYLSTGTGGVGYEDVNSGGNMALITYNLLTTMYTQAVGAYVRIPFTLTSQQKQKFNSLTLAMQYDDGFVAYINGQEVQRDQFIGVPNWYSNASSHENYGTVYFDISQYLDALKVGENILAIHGMNYSSGSSDFLIWVELIAGENRPSGVSDTAIQYTGDPIVLEASRQIKARARASDETWSALNEATFAVGPVADNLRISEVMYHPAGDPNNEFIELQNIGEVTIDLSLVRFTDGIDFVFDPFALQEAPLLEESFDVDSDDFTFVADAFGTNYPDETEGQYDLAGGVDGGGLYCLVIGSSAQAASGGWSRIFDLSQDAQITVYLRHRMIMGSGYDVDEYGQVVLTVDGVRYGQDVDDSLFHRAGDGDGGVDADYGWQESSIVVSLTAGSHTLVVGGYTNASSTPWDEWTEVYLDDVSISMFVPQQTLLEPGQYMVLVRNRMKFFDLYGAGSVIGGQYNGALENAGERIKLLDALGTPIQDFTFKDSWHPITDGEGFSLTLRDPYSTDPNTWTTKEGWRPSAMVGGSPGYDDSGVLPAPGSIVINEVL
ncbi:MAG: lamin tail domain-containing protein, partial [Sedimentisphaerales bacterium]|nr:lamin tail domain-containing protein [Sedimentisphaerales bacterium]